MKTVRLILLSLVAVLALLGGTTITYAFHSGGVAECGGCHSMHSPAPGGVNLLVGTDQSSTCLSCHEHAGDTGPSSYHISTAEADMPSGSAPKQRTPGGDFGWLKKTYTFTVRGTVNTESGQTHGHNIVAVDKNYVADTDNTTAPGGSGFVASGLACVSCHDPHGKYRRLSTGAIAQAGAPIGASGSYNGANNEPSATKAVGVYRLLAGSGYTTGGVTFPGVPAAKVPSTYNQTEATNQVRAAYGVATANGHATWGNWCGTCHPGMHSNGNYVHPVDTPLGSGIINNYNAYVSSGNMGGSSTSSFLSLVPFVENTGDYTTLAAHASNTNAYLNGPTDGDQVACLSCHRAHASGFPEGLRWQMEGEFITSVDGSGNAVWPGTDTTPGSPQFARGRTSAETQAAYYDRPVTVFGPYQRVLCNKCHAQD